MAVVQGVGRWVDAFAARTRRAESDALAAILALANASDVISFSGGFPDPATFPGEELADLLRELLLSKDASVLQYGPTRGLPGLRDYLAERLERLEGRRPGEDELLVTSGGIEALELLGKAFLDPGDRTAVEAPTYLGAIMAFQSFQADVSGIPMDGDGLVVEAAADALGRSGTGGVARPTSPRTRAGSSRSIWRRAGSSRSHPVQLAASMPCRSRARIKRRWSWRPATAAWIR